MFHEKDWTVLNEPEDGHVTFACGKCFEAEMNKSASKIHGEGSELAFEWAPTSCSGPTSYPEVTTWREGGLIGMGDMDQVAPRVRTGF